MNLVPIPIFFFIENNNANKMSNSCFWWIIGLSILTIIFLLALAVYIIFDNETNNFMYECKIFFKDLFKGFKAR